MKFIIFGAGGQLGREWMHQIKEQGDPVYEVINARGLRSNEADITDHDHIDQILADEMPEVVINCAAYTKVDKAESDREEAEKVNSLAVKNLAESCQQRGIKLVHYSTDYVFEGTMEDKHRFPEGYPEDHETDPVNWYGETKRQGEEAILQSGAEHLTIRTSWVCGQFGSNFVRTMLSLAKTREELDVVNDQWGSPSFTQNLVYNTAVLLRNQKNGTYHVTSNGLISWYDLASEIFNQTGKDIRLNAVNSELFTTTAQRPKFSKLNTNKLAAVPGSDIEHWKDGLKNLLNSIT